MQETVDKNYKIVVQTGRKFVGAERNCPIYTNTTGVIFS